MTGVISRYKNYLFYDPFIKKTLFILLILFELCLSVTVVLKIKYTEIDWIAYMEEVEGFLNGTLDYDELKGQTGPLVYPAGFVYFYAVLYYITSKGVNIMLAQFVFIAFYLMTLVGVFRIYSKFEQIPSYAIAMLCLTSYRIHSIFMLRLFNDAIAVMIVFGAFNCFMSRRHSLGSLLFSVAISVKMNILLFGPALLVILLHRCGFWKTVEHLVEMLLVQVIVGLPFLAHNTSAYMGRAFEFSRQFLYKWTVNWRLVSEPVFLDRRFQLSLLSLHIVLLSIVLYKYTRSQKQQQSDKNRTPGNKSDISEMPFSTNDIFTLFLSNFIGVACSRSLHYQFYVWYYHSLPLLLWHMSGVHDVIRLLLWGLIEVAWNTYPSTVLSSTLLNLCHVVMLYKLVISYTHTSRIMCDKKTQ